MQYFYCKHKMHVKNINSVDNSKMYNNLEGLGFHFMIYFAYCLYFNIIFMNSFSSVFTNVHI